MTTRMWYLLISLLALGVVELVQQIFVSAVTGAQAGEVVTVSGVVTFADTGGGAKASVYAQGGPDDYFYASTRTDSLGRYSLELPPGQYTLRFEPRFSTRHLPEWYDNAYELEGATLITAVAGSTLTNINAALDVGGTVNGRVTGMGAPVEHLAVSLIGVSGYGEETFTNSYGAYEFEGILPGSYLVHFSGEGYLLDEYYNNAHIEAEATAVAIALGSSLTLDAELEMGGILKGSITDVAGFPFDNASLSIYPSKAVTEPVSVYPISYSGRYTQTLPAGTYYLLAQGGYYYSGHGVARPEYWENKATLAAADPVVITAGAETVADFQLDLDGHIIGTVVNQQGDIIYAPVKVKFFDALSLDVAAETQGYGSFSSPGLPDGDYLVYVEGIGSDAPGEYYEDAATLAAATPVTVVANENTDITMAYDVWGSIHGRITNSTTLAPIDSAIIELWNMDFELAYQTSTTTNADGAFALSGLLPGTYLLRAKSDLYGTQYYGGISLLQAKRLVINGPGDDVEVNFALSPAQNVRLYVIDGETGYAINNGNVYVRPASDCAVRPEIADTFDYYFNEFLLSGLVPGVPYELFVTQERDQTQVYGPIPFELPVSGESQREVIELEVTKQPGEISGYVTDAATGAAVVGKYIYAEAYGHPLPVSQYAYTDANGRFTLSNLPPGIYNVYSGPPLGDSTPYIREERSGIRLSNARPTRMVNFSLLPGGQISGTMQEDNFDPTFGEVWIFNSDGSRVSTARPRFDGSYLSEGLPAGSYRVLFVPKISNKAAKYYVAADTLAGAIPVEVKVGEVTGEINIVLSEIETAVVGTINPPQAGRVQGGLTVEAYDKDGGLMAEWVSSYGEFSLRNLPQNDYIVRVAGTKIYNPLLSCPRPHLAAGTYYDKKGTFDTATPVTSDAYPSPAIDVPISLDGRLLPLPQQIYPLYLPFAAGNW